MCETLKTNIYLELNATTSKLTYNRHMWTQRVACVIFYLRSKDDTISV